MKEMKLKLVIYIGVTLVAFLLMLLGYSQLVVIPKSREVKGITNEINFLEEKEYHFLRARVALFQINSLNVRSNNYSDILKENMDILEASLITLDDLSLGQAEQEVVNDLVEMKNSLKLSFAENDPVVSYDPSSVLKIPDVEEIENYQYLLRESYALFEDYVVDNTKLLELKETAYQLELAAPMSLRPDVFSSVSYKELFSTYLNMLYQIKEEVHFSQTASLRDEKGISALVALSNLLLAYSNKIDVLESNHQKILELID